MRREGLAVGLFFVVAGVLFLLDAVEVLRIRASYLWPLLLIGFGIALIAGTVSPAEPKRPPEPPPPSEEKPEADEEHEPPEERPEGPGEERPARDDRADDDRGSEP